MARRSAASSSESTLTRTPCRRRTDLLGTWLSDPRVLSTLASYSQLVDWAADLGAISAIAVEGTNCYGAGLTRFVTGHGHTVVEVNRPDRALRRRRGKSDTIDAEAAAPCRAVRVATAAPKASDGTVAMIRMLKTAKNSAVKARTQALNQIHAIVLTAPAALREELAELRTPALTERYASLRPGELSSPAAVARHTLRLLARRALALLAEVTGLNSQIEILAKLVDPGLHRHPHAVQHLARLPPVGLARGARGLGRAGPHQSRCCRGAGRGRARPRAAPRHRGADRAVARRRQGWVAQSSRRRRRTCGCREPCHQLGPASLRRPALAVTVPCQPSMIARRGPRTCLPDARSHAVLAGAARPLRHRQGRGDLDPAPRGRRAAPHQPPAHPGLDRARGTSPAPRMVSGGST